MTEHDEREQWDADRDLLAPLEAGADALARQDVVISGAAEAAAAGLRRPRAFAAWPIALAAGAAAGIAVTPLLPPVAPGGGASPGALTLPADYSRSGVEAGAPTPVAEAPADAWYRYIQELVYRGEAALAEQHLRAFVELHPEYRHER